MVFVGGGGDNMCVYVYERIHAETIKAGKDSPCVSLHHVKDSILKAARSLWRVLIRSIGPDLNFREITCLTCEGHAVLSGTVPPCFHSNYGFSLRHHGVVNKRICPSLPS